MDTENPSAPTRPQSRIPGKNHPRRRPRSGVVHDNTRHTERFTVIGNHLTQHPELSGLAIGLGAHIQSLPAGAPVDIKTLAARFPEGATRIAAALRELETHGYLRRTRERTPDGRIVTRTVSCNRPGHHGTADTGAAPGPPARRPAPPTRRSAPPDRGRASSARRPVPAERPPRKALPAVPKPAHPSPALLRTAVDLLGGLRRTDPRLLLSATDAEHLAPGVVAWLERDLTPGAVRHALTRDLPPEDLHRPAALLAHRLTAHLPPPPPFRAPAPPPVVRHPLRNCDGCDRGIRAAEPGLCRDCRSDPLEAA
ncbi:helix-turn-helix domain-containing protein [Streptomyces sp. NPDC096324]|uniref:helix-turn-helix domain-containing protein n=1 Tax=Streptomyces sp. NPDC096324 TaxID=3366085 RepID=UPI003828EF2C